MEIKRRATADSAVLNRAARCLASPYIDEIGALQERAAQIDWGLRSPHCDRSASVALHLEAGEVSRRATELLATLESEAARAPAGVANHSRVGDVRRALGTVSARVGRLDKGALHLRQG